jgi:hypothetical protein
MAPTLALPIPVVDPTTYGQEQPTHAPGTFIGTGPTIVGLAPCTWRQSPMQWVQCNDNTDPTVSKPV